jgi:hypothetical protein
MPAAKSLINYWTSSDLSRLIKGTLGNAEPIGYSQENLTYWQVLQAEIIRLNTRGVYHLPQLQPIQTRMLDELPLEPDDGSSTYIPFRRCLGLLADLLTLFRRKVTNVHGPECWNKASLLFEDDPRSNMLFGLLRDVSAAPRLQTVDCLERISRTGIRFAQLGTTRARFRSRDCGMEALVRISTKMLAFLGWEFVNTAPSVGETSRVTVDVDAGKRVILRYKGNRVELRDRDKDCFLLLFCHDTKMLTYEELWHGLIEKDTGKGYKQNPKGGGPPDLLRQIKCHLNKRITQHLGRPPVGGFWIERIPREGYQLNRSSLVWQWAKGVPDRAYERTLDPSVIDRESTRGYRR